jgi:hypothetical protein
MLAPGTRAAYSPRVPPGEDPLPGAGVPAHRPTSADMGSAWPRADLAFITRTGRLIEPHNLVRSFRRICDTS